MSQSTRVTGLYGRIPTLVSNFRADYLSAAIKVAASLRSLRLTRRPGRPRPGGRAQLAGLRYWVETLPGFARRDLHGQHVPNPNLYLGNFLELTVLRSRIAGADADGSAVRGLVEEVGARLR
jgi:hypothetical protein